MERYKKLIDSGKGPEILDPDFLTFPKEKQKRIVQMVRNRISAQNSRNRKKASLKVILFEKGKLESEN